MARTVKFVLEGDSSSLLREGDKVIAQQNRLEKEFGDTAAAAEQAGRRETAAAKRTAEAYELADRRMTAAVRSRPASARVTRSAAYALAPQNSTTMAAAAAAVGRGDGSTYGLARTDEQQFARFVQARQIRAGRAAARTAEAAIAVARTKSITERMDRERGQEVADAHEQIRWNNYQAKVARIRRGEGELKAANAAALRYGGAAAAVAAGAAVAGTAESLREGRDTNIDFATDFAKLGSLGDNVERLPQKRQEVLAYSAAWGVAAKEVVAGLYGIESAFSKMTDAERAAVAKGALELKALQPELDLETGGKAIGKTLEIYRYQIRSAAEAKNYIRQIADLGDLEYGPFAALAPDLMARAKAAGVNPMELGGDITVATQGLGRTEKTFTSLADVYQKTFLQKDKLGVDTSKGWAHTVGQLAGVDPELRAEVYGTDAGTVQLLVDQREAAKKYSDELGSMVLRIREVGAAADDTADRLKKLSADPAMGYAAKAKALDEATKNIPLEKDYAWGDFDLRAGSREYAIKKRLPQMFQWAAPLLNVPLTIAEESGGLGLAVPGAKDAWRQLGDRDMQDKLDAGGRTDISFAPTPKSMPVRVTGESPMTPTFGADLVWERAKENWGRTHDAVWADGRVSPAEQGRLDDATRLLAEAARLQMQAAQMSMDAAKASAKAGADALRDAAAMGFGVNTHTE